MAKHYLHYGYYHKCHNSNNSNNSNNIFLRISTHESGIRGRTLGLKGGKHSYIQGAAIAAKILRKPDGVCTSFLADTPPKQVSSTVFDSPQVSDTEATEQHIRPKVYIGDALPEEPSGIVTAQPEQTIAWPKHGDASRSHGTFLHESSRAATPWNSLQVPGPSQSPRVDEPHLASIASTRSAVAWSARKCVAQVVRDSAGVTDWNHRKLAEDTLNGNDVQDRFLVVKLVYDPRANRFQPAYKTEPAIMSIIAITHIIEIIMITCIIVIIVIKCITDIISIIIIITIVRIIVGFQEWDEGTFEGLGASVRHSRCGEQEQYTSIPDWSRRDNESSIIDTWRPYHDEVQSMTAIERFRRKRIAVNSLHTLVLGVSDHQTIEPTKMPFASGWFLQFQRFKEGINLQNNRYKMHNVYNR